MREEILRMIEKNSKINLHDMAVMLGKDEKEIANEIQDMENEKIICGYHTMIDWDKTNSEKVVALIELKISPERGEGYDKIAKRISKFREVSSLYLMSGAFDIAVFIEGKTMKQVAAFVSEKIAPLDTVLSTSTHFVLKKYKDHGVTMVGEENHERMAVTP